jgi:hypothetical protein
VFALNRIRRYPQFSGLWISPRTPLADALWTTLGRVAHSSPALLLSTVNRKKKKKLHTLRAAKNCPTYGVHLSAAGCKSLKYS